MVSWVEIKPTMVEMTQSVEPALDLMKRDVFLSNKRDINDQTPTWQTTAIGHRSRFLTYGSRRRRPHHSHLALLPLGDRKGCGGDFRRLHTAEFHSRSHRAFQRHAQPSARVAPVRFVRARRWCHWFQRGKCSSFKPRHLSDSGRNPAARRTEALFYLNGLERNSIGLHDTFGPRQNSVQQIPRQFAN
jgi:hypothetical protein